MSTKSRLTSLLILFVMLISLLVVGAYAVKQTDFGVGGSIKFTAKGVDATISLVSLNNGAFKDGSTPVENGKLTDVVITSAMQEDYDFDTLFAPWNNLDLKFTDEENGTPVTLVMSITNDAPATSTRVIDVTVTVSDGTAVNCTVDCVNEEGTKTSTIYPTNTATFTITFTVGEISENASLTGFNVNFNMVSRRDNTLDEGEYSLLKFTPLEGTTCSVAKAYSVSSTTTGTIEIPNKVLIDGVSYTVTSIERDAFKGCSSLEKIIIPDGVTSIGSSAFYNCTSLTSITIPDGVTSIGFSAFYKCIGFSSIRIPDGVTTIGPTTFSGCTGLTSISIGDNVTSIDKSAFNNVNTSVYKEVDNAYYLQTRSEKNAYLIKAKSTDITSCEIDDNCKIICNAFYNCTSLTSIRIPDGVTSVGSSAFYKCTSLTSITIPDSVTSIGENAFEGCTGLTSIIIGDSVTSIGFSAFNGCTSLTSITIPDGVTIIEDYTFKGCTRPADVYYAGTEEEWNAITIGKSNDIFKYATIHYESTGA